MLLRFIRNPSIVVLIILGIAAAGTYEFFTLPVALYPSTSRPAIEVRVPLHPYTAISFRDELGERIESKIAEIPGVEDYHSFYYDGSASWNVYFTWGTEEDDAKADLRSAITPLVNQLDSQYQGLFIAKKRTSGTGSNVNIQFSDSSQSLEDLYRLLDDRLKPKLEKVADVDQITIAQPSSKVVDIDLSFDKLAYYGINPEVVARTIKSHKHNLNLGQLETESGGASYRVNLILSKDSIKRLQRLPIGLMGKRTVFLEDVAQVSLSSETPRSIFRGNGQDSIIVTASPSDKANLDQFSTDIKEQISAMVDQLNGSNSTITYSVLTDPSEFIRESVDNVIVSIAIGMATAMIILFLFMGSFRSTLIIGLSIPVSILGGVILMAGSGLELNLVSMGAMALAVGMVVDSSIVVYENIIRNLEIHKPISLSEWRDTIYRSVVEVRTAVVVSIITTIIVFLPLPFTAPLASAILGDLATVVIYILVLSVAVSLFVIPPLTALLQKNSSSKQKGKLYFLHHGFKKGMDGLQRSYLATLRKILKNRWIASALVGGSFSLVAGSIYLLTTQIPKEVMATPETEWVVLVASAKDQSSQVEHMVKTAKKYEKKVQEGYGHLSLGMLSIINKRQAVILLRLKEKKLVHQIKSQMEAEFKETPLFRFFIVPWTATSLRIPDPPLLKIAINSEDEDQKRDALRRIGDIVREFPELSQNFETNPQTRKSRSFDIQLKEDVIYDFKQRGTNLTEQSLMSVVQYALGKHVVQSLDIDGQLIPVKLGQKKYSITSPQELKNTLIRVDDTVLPLRDFVDVKISQKWTDYYSENGSQMALGTIREKETFKGDRIDLRQRVKKKILSDSELDQNLLTFLDADEEITENIVSLTQALIMALMLISIVVLCQFGNVFQSLVVLVAIPLGFVGVGTSLYAFNSTISINSMLGLILLCGTAVNNSIIFVDFFNAIRSQSPSEPLDKMIVEAAASRFRPIMITTLTTIIGMLPLALALGSGSEVLRPLGIAISGGLGISTFFTLLLVPIGLSYMRSEAV